MSLTNPPTNKHETLDPSLWKTDDTEWLKARKAEWRQVKQNLSGMDLEIERRAHKFHKDYFLKGEIHPATKNWKLGCKTNHPSVFAGGKLFFDIWYSPVCDKQLFQQIFAQDIFGGELCYSQDFLFRFDQRNFSSDYGMLGGREKTAVEVLYPSLDCTDTRLDAQATVWLCPPPKRLVMQCFNAINSLTHSANTNPFHPGQYLWEHLKFSLSRYPEKFEFIEGEHKRDRHQRIFLKVLSFYDREGTAVDRPSVVAFRDKIVEQFEARDMPNILQKSWDSAKSKYEAGDW